MENQQLLIKEVLNVSKETSENLKKIEARLIKFEILYKSHEDDIAYLNDVVFRGSPNKKAVIESLADLSRQLDFMHRKIEKNSLKSEQAIANRNQIIWGLVVACVPLIWGTAISFFNLEQTNDNGLFPSLDGHQNMFVAKR